VYAATAMLNTLDLEGRPQDTRVVVAMSGGVDSSVTAALLKHEGYDVVGVTLQLYDHGAATHRKGACCAGQDIHDARAVAERIGIPHYVLDYESRFKEAVIDRFAASYMAGETPVPCVECNQSVKFRDLLTTARELGARVLATGHYVASRKLPRGGRALYRARDSERDQSYFLFATTREQLDPLRFPLGERSKAETRELARRFDLPVADKQDSQDICFVPSGRYAQVIERLRPGAAEPGDIVDIEGSVLGRHDGIIHFTVGQRRGLRVATGHPLYVVRLDAVTRRVVVGPRAALRISAMRLRDVNWLGDGTLDEALADASSAGGAPSSAGPLGAGPLGAGRAGGDGREVFVKVRSTRAPQPAWLRPCAGGVEVELVAGEDGVSPGQACVFYDAQEGQARVLGGGIIQSAAAAGEALPRREAVAGRAAAPG
jgi:tRNA-uridine 2-sulfurtransferase